MALQVYYPEMGDTKPANTQGDIRVGAYGIYLKTPLALQGQGIKYLGVLQASGLTAQAQHKAGWNEYRLTSKALARLTARYDFASEALLS